MTQSLLVLLHTKPLASAHRGHVRTASTQTAMSSFSKRKTRKPTGPHGFLASDSWVDRVQPTLHTLSAKRCLFFLCVSSRRDFQIPEVSVMLRCVSSGIPGISVGKHEQHSHCVPAEEEANCRRQSWPTFMESAPHVRGECASMDRMCVGYKGKSPSKQDALCFITIMKYLVWKHRFLI